jgi:hypothetical protein
MHSIISEAITDHKCIYLKCVKFLNRHLSLNEKMSLYMEIHNMTCKYFFKYEKYHNAVGFKSICEYLDFHMGHICEFVLSLENKHTTRLNIDKYEFITTDELDKLVEKIKEMNPCDKPRYVAQ